MFGLVLLGTLSQGMGCTAERPEPLSEHPPALELAPMLAPATKAAWTAFFERRCRPKPEVPVQVEAAACEAGRLATELQECEGARACIAVVRRARACEGGWNGPLPAGDPVRATLVRVVEEDCDGFLDAVKRSPSGEATWWARGGFSNAGWKCIERSEHPDASRWMDRRRSPVDAVATVDRLRRRLRTVESSRSDWSERSSFWSVFDGLPRDQKLELVRSLRRVAATEAVDTWHDRGWRHEALKRLGQLGDTESIPVMRAALGDSRSWWLQAAAAEALGELGPAGGVALDELTAAATEHWSFAVRAVAKRAAEQVAGGSPPELERRSVVPPRDPGYPEVSAPLLGSPRTSSYRTFEPWSVSLGGERIEFKSQHLEVASLPRELESFDLAQWFPDAPGIGPWRTQLTAVEKVGSGWVLGTDVGEFGGGAWFVTADGRARTLLSQNIIGAIEFKGVRYLLQGLGHMGSPDGSILRIDETPGGVALRRMVELSFPPHEVAVVGDHLLQATPFGVVVVSASFEISMHPYQTRRARPEGLPEEYEAAVLAAIEQDHDAVQRCLTPLKGLSDGCLPRKIPAGTGVWFDVERTGTVTAVVPFEARDDDHGRPPTPEVAACIARVAASWTLPPLAEGWTTFGMTLAPD